MNYWIKVLTLGLYVPIIVFSGISCWLFISKMLVPAFKSRRLDVEHYAIGISALLSLGAHLGENMLYGSVRWFDSMKFLDRAFMLVSFWKLLILASAIFAVVALNKSDASLANLRRVATAALIVWAFGALAATQFV